MRPRWHDWVIAASIIVLAATGIWTLWGEDLRRLFRAEPAVAEPAAGETASPAKPAAPAPPVAPPPGQAAGPY